MNRTEYDHYNNIKKLNKNQLEGVNSQNKMEKVNNVYGKNHRLERSEKQLKPNYFMKVNEDEDISEISGVNSELYTLNNNKHTNNTTVNRSQSPFKYIFGFLK